MEGSFAPSSHSVETQPQFRSPEEEVAHLRAQLAEKEREVLGRQPEIDQVERESLGREVLREHNQFTPKVILNTEYEISQPHLHEAVASIETAHDPVEEIIALAKQEGIKNALTVLERSNSPHLVDETHRRLVELIAGGAEMADLREGVPPWQVMHMTLFEVTLPSHTGIAGQVPQFTELVGRMEQLFQGLRTIGSRKTGNHFVFEIAVGNDTEDIVFYVAVPNEFVNLFEKQTQSLFPQAVLTVQPHDYNVFTAEGVTAMAEVTLEKHAIYPLQSLDQFTADPLEVVLNAFSNIARNEGAAVQFVIRHPNDGYRKKYETIIKHVEKGLYPKEAISRATVGGAVFAEVGAFLTTKKKLEETSNPAPEVDNEALQRFRTKINRDLLEVNIRVVVSAGESGRVGQLMHEVQSAFHQFNTTEGNSLKFNRLSGAALKRAEKAFSFRQFDTKKITPLNLTELATMAHLPGHGVQSTSQYKESFAQTAAAPTAMPDTGTLLGLNKHRSAEKPIYISDEDRLRHFYIIGQTGTGKTTLMKNMIVQDIQRGNGVCMIDPHGTDIEDVLAAVPPEREQDVIYFDPSRMDKVVGLNMLEYDYSKPEQKTFVVNELFSIFQKLYGANPESMGPMFEQYFRNATMLVMEDPDSGNTLMDIGRVLSDSAYRRAKLRKATNPVVVQFWTEIAGKAGGEAALENIVPYIVSKFDVFTANDYMRPIIGQQKSAFDFRQVMDQKKILLVNLAKGRLGEINANLIGMIFVGKILMAALSRVDDPTRGFPPFYLHMDEFQNVSTNSISAILSEARKYKLGLTIAHQFIAQLQPDIKDAVFGNVGSMAAFRVGPEDSQFLEAQYSPTFSSSDLMNVPNRNAFLKVLANGAPTSPFSISTMAPQETDLERVQMMIEQSYQRHGRNRDEIEAEIAQRYQKPRPPMPPAPTITSARL